MWGETVRYIFEDKSTSPLSQIILSRLSDTMKSKVTFAGGNNNIAKWLKSREETYAVWLDVSPYNERTITIHNDIVGLANSGWAIITVPIINSEHGYLEVCSKHRAVRDSRRVLDTLQFKLEEPKIGFERQCKICAKQHLASCALLRKKQIPKFMGIDCADCIGRHDWCDTSASRACKVDEYAGTFGLMPVRKVGSVGCSVDSIIKVVDSRVDDINSMIGRVGYVADTLARTDW